MKTGNLEKYLNAGLTALEARKLDAKEKIEWDVFDKKLFPDDYFSPHNEGKTFFLPHKIGNYSSLPSSCIILADGTIFAVEIFHRDVAAWLEYNGFDLKGNLRCVYLRNERNLLFRAGYDFFGNSGENNYEKLKANWDELFESHGFEYDVELTQPQVRAIYFLSRFLKLDFERTLQGSDCFRMNPFKNYPAKQRRVGADNDWTVTHALKSLTMEEIRKI